MTGTELISAAREFAFSRHEGLVRPNRACQPYSVHLTEVAELIEQSGGSAEEIAAGYLHDVLEDTLTTLGEIGAYFGTEVARLVDGLTDPPEWKGTPTLKRKLRQAERLSFECDGVKRCKHADSTSNVRSCVTDPPTGWTRQKFSDYLLGAKVVADACSSVSPYLVEQFNQAYTKAIHALDIHYPPE